jgi:hypothetical protein
MRYKHSGKTKRYAVFRVESLYWTLLIYLVMLRKYGFEVSDNF